MIHVRDFKENLFESGEIAPFNELILSWNGKRPALGSYLFSVSVYVPEEGWSPWLSYAKWGAAFQSSFSHQVACVRSDQDTVDILEGKKATAFRIQVEKEGGQDQNTLTSLHIYTNGEKIVPKEEILQKNTSLSLPFPKLSQMAIHHEHATRLCSPTSTTALVWYCLGAKEIDPSQFAQNVWDQGHDIYGNWVFNVAQASHYLGTSWECWVERLSGFSSILEKLYENEPVVVSIRGPILGGALPYAGGHLVVVIGYDAVREEVLCMDPAFASHEETHVRYALVDFLQAWSRRGNVAYVFRSCGRH